VQPDGATVQHSYWSQTKIDTYLTTDEKGHWLETIQESTRAYVKTKFQYDEAGRRIEVDTYDRSGKLVRKTITKYEDDANGSWTERRDFYWDITSSEKPPKLSTIRRRTITYY
jgi:YD repeat-containing protein